MTPQQFSSLVTELRGLGRRVSWLERVVYGFVGGLTMLGFLLANGLIKIGGH